MSRLNDNMDAGVEAAGWTRLKIPKSANYKFTSSALMLGDEPLEIHTATSDELVALRSQYGRPGKSSSESPVKFWKWMEKVVEKAIKKGVGNCGEVVAAALYYLKNKKKLEDDLDYVNVLDGATMNAVVPHVIAVIGRQGDVVKGIGLPSTWGDSAVVCDPWDRVVYPASQYDMYWGGLRTHSKSPDDLNCELVIRVPWGVDT